MENLILLKNILLDGRQCNILIEGKHFKDTDAPAEVEGAQVVDCTGKAILPALYNTHNHAAMTLMRGYADDMELNKWLTEYIWPFEDKMTAADIRRGSEIAVKEMIDSGSVFFNDMYFEIDETIDIVARSGMRACIGLTVMDYHSLAVQEQKLNFVKTFQDPTGGRINLAMAPHAIYTVNGERFRKSVDFAREQGIKVHTHIAETKKEVEDCIAAHGMTPVRYLDSLGVLGPDVIAAHCIYVDEQEWDILAERGVTVSHCPCSNMKLGSGRFPYDLAIRSGVNITLGTDGASSNNNLDLREEMKFAALFAKFNGEVEQLPAKQVFQWATENGAKAFGIHAGKIEAGYLADAILLDMNNPRMTPCHHIISNWVYSADSSCITNVLCDGKFIK